MRACLVVKQRLIMAAVLRGLSITIIIRRYPVGLVGQTVRYNMSCINGLTQTSLNTRYGK